MIDEHVLVGSVIGTMGCLWFYLLQKGSLLLEGDCSCSFESEKTLQITCCEGMVFEHFFEIVRILNIRLCLLFFSLGFFVFLDALFFEKYFSFIHVHVLLVCSAIYMIFWFSMLLFVYSDSTLTGLKKWGWLFAVASASILGFILYLLFRIGRVRSSASA